MQDKYAGDIGDFVKLGLLRALSPNRKLGIAWYKYPDENNKSDGKIISYLSKDAIHKELDSDLYDHLKNVVSNERTIASLQSVFTNVEFHDDSASAKHLKKDQRSAWRTQWFEGVMQKLENCDLVFADPDNGMIDDSEHRRREFEFGKQIPLSEVKSIAKGRCAIIYHHNTRRAGGHKAEIQHWLEAIGTSSMAVRARAFSPRTFFIINPDTEIQERVRIFCQKWRIMKVELV